MKLKVPLVGLCETHNGIAMLSDLPLFSKYRSSLESVSRKIRGALERSGARVDERGWLASRRMSRVPIGLEINLSELDALIFLLTAVEKYVGGPQWEAVEPIHDTLLEKRVGLTDAPEFGAERKRG